MIDINKLRRLTQAALIGPVGVSLNWLTSLQDFQKEANPAAISELLDRLEAAETELAELRSSMKFRTSLIGRTEAERDALRAKIEAMERQEPVALVKWQVGGQVVHIIGDVKVGDILYALPGAQGEEK